MKKKLLGLSGFKRKMSIGKFRTQLKNYILNYFWIGKNSTFNWASCYLSDLISWYSSKVPCTLGTYDFAVLQSTNTLTSWGLGICCSLLDYKSQDCLLHHLTFYSLSLPQSEEVVISLDHLIKEYRSFLVSWLCITLHYLLLLDLMFYVYLFAFFVFSQ